LNVKKTAKFYATHPEARAKKAAYDKRNDARPERRARRAELTKINREKGTAGNGDGKDWSHTKNGVVMKKASVNRASKTDSAGDARARGGKKTK
jgi:hypothetical protein